MFTTDTSSALSLAHRRGHELRLAAASERLCATPPPRRRIAASLRRTADLLERAPLVRTPARIS